MTSFLDHAGCWFLHSGIQERDGGVARYYRSDSATNAAVSTEITGYAASALAYLHSRTRKQEYLDAAVRAAQYLTHEVWDSVASTFPFEPGSDRAYFFDIGIIVRGLLAVWRATGEEEFRTRAQEATLSMAFDFLGDGMFHPVISLPDKQPLPEEPRWSRRPGCYQLKSAVAWREIGDPHARQLFDAAVAVALTNHERFLEEEKDREKLMDRLHAYCYFLEALLFTDARDTLTSGIRRVGQLLREIAPSFERSDVNAQLLRVRLVSHHLGVVPLDEGAALEEASRTASFQVLDASDPRLRGGFWFGRKGEQMLPFSNPVSTAFCLQALALWDDHQIGALELRTPAIDLTEVKVLFASGSDPVVTLVLERVRTIFPELPLLVVSEFPVTDVEWIPYHIRRTWAENRDLIQAKLAVRRVRLAAVILEPRIPHWRLRALGFALAPMQFVAFNEMGEHFMLRPRSVPTMLRHVAWRMKNVVRSQRQPESSTYRAMEWIRKPEKFRLSMLYRTAMARGRTLAHSRPVQPLVPVAENRRPRGISVVIPSRNGRELLERCLPGIQDAHEIIVVDNGSDDRTAEYLGQSWPQVVIEHSPKPLAFSVAVNRGIRRARFSHVCVLNNDMRVEGGFFEALLRPFETVPNLFCSTAQIFLPEGRRREETGKTVMNPAPGVTEFPVRCDIPLEGEDHSYVLYGSGGCSLYDAAKLEALGGFDEVYQPAYVEDLDLGVRGWVRGWPSVYCAGARVLHEHRATTSRYFSAEDLDRALEVNYVQFLARAVGDPETFSRLWQRNVLRLKALERAAGLSAAAHQATTPIASGDMRFLDLVNGEVAVFPGRAASGKPVILVASPYVPFPLSHGAAVRIYNLMRRAAVDFDPVLVAFTEESQSVPRELREICTEIVTVRRAGSHALPSRGRPDTVEEFDTPAYHAALRQTITKWKPGIVQLEFTQMAMYVPDCVPARTILVEHDITYDLYAQMLATGSDDWEVRRQHQLWTSFETAAWRQVDRVVTMSDKDRDLIAGATAIPNGVDLERFQPSSQPPEPRRLLFIGSFAHRPNVMALEFFLRDVFPRLDGVILHVIAGQRHQRFWDLQHAGVEVEGFVSDVRPAYQRATLVIAPLVASAGTNVKILEAMAMGKAVVSTEAGIHGLELGRGTDVVVTDSAEAMAAAITRLLENPDERAKIEAHARQTVERVYGWDAIAREQKKLYESLLQLPSEDGVV